ncbi:hypothetical protein [Pedobacter suwonensis]|uniref:hypothetical protein n=1 Tax=Pedobacter suwonensis TaxID=332999 RepID=UPI0036C7F90F
MENTSKEFLFEKMSDVMPWLLLVAPFQRSLVGMQAKPLKFDEFIEPSTTGRVNSISESK